MQSCQISWPSRNAEGKMPNWFLTGLEESLQFLRLDGSPVRTLDLRSAVFRIRRLWTKFMGVEPNASRKRSATTDQLISAQSATGSTLWVASGCSKMVPTARYRLRFCSPGSHGSRLSDWSERLRRRYAMHWAISALGSVTLPSVAPPCFVNMPSKAVLT